MGIRKDYQPWTEEQRTFVRENYKFMSSPDIAKALGRTQGSVYSYVKQLKDEPGAGICWVMHRKAIGL